MEVSDSGVASGQQVNGLHKSVGSSNLGMVAGDRQGQCARRQNAHQAVGMSLPAELGTGNPLLADMVYKCALSHERWRSCEAR